MQPDARAAERFFRGILAVCPTASLSHLYLSHWPTEFPSPLSYFVEAGFQGEVVAARASIVEGIRREFPQVKVRLDDHPTGGQVATHLLMELPQGRQAGLNAIDAALANLAADGRLWLFGHRENGIQSVTNSYTEVVTELFKGHMRLLSLGAATSRMVARPGRAVARPDPDGFHELIHEDLRLATLPGVFSWEEVDPASRLLLTAMTEDPGLRVLDWGCGVGLLGVAIAKRWPDSRLVMSDDLWSAVRCAKRSAEWNGVNQRCTVLAEDGIGPKLTGMRFFTIVSNPPLHRGPRTDHRMVRRFIPAALDLLLPGGSLWLVADGRIDFAKLFGGVERCTVEAVVEETPFTVWRLRLLPTIEPPKTSPEPRRGRRR